MVKEGTFPSSPVRRRRLCGILRMGTSGLLFKLPGHLQCSRVQVGCVKV